ncbi:MAG: MATE family efflux transporter [Rhizobiaceae bacterium]|nr:MATE family efflux transporter [Rhizobiaceae bacterium]
MTFAYVTTPLIGLADTAVVGQLGDAALIGGLAAGAIVFDVVFSTFNGLRSGTTGLVAQAFGRNDEREQRHVLIRALLLATAIGLSIAILSPLISLAGQRFMGAEAAVNIALDQYVRIRCLAAPVALANYAILGYVLGRGEGTLGLALQILLNCTNILLSVLLGLYFGWGVSGVAWGTVIAECVAMLAGAVLIARRFRQMAALQWSSVLDIGAVKAMLALNGDIMIRSFCLLAAFALFAKHGASLGTVTLAANAVLLHLFMIASFFLDGFATAAEQLAGRALGAGARLPFVRAVKLTALWGFGFALGAVLVFLLFGSSLLSAMTTADDVRREAARYLPWAAFTGLSGVLAFQMDGVFIGATWSRDMRNMMLVSLGAFLVALALLEPRFGNAGLWAALHIFLLFRGLTLLAMLRLRLSGIHSSG